MTGYYSHLFDKFFFCGLGIGNAVANSKTKSFSDQTHVTETWTESVSVVLLPVLFSFFVGDVWQESNMTQNTKNDAEQSFVNEMNFAVILMSS